MATQPIRPGAGTLLDFAKSLDPDGKPARVAELLTQSNEVLLDLPWIEGNLPTGHRTTLRTALPTSTWRQLYQGVQPSKSDRAQITDSCGMLENRAELDKDMVELNGNVDAYRMSEAMAFLEGMNQDFVQTLVYGDVNINPERFTGLTPRYNTLSVANPISQNVISAGGAGADNTSIWLCVWGEQTGHGIFPKGSTMGLVQEDLGIIDAFDNQVPPARYRAYAERYQWKCGLTIRDWRYFVRICNIDVSDLVGQTATQSLAAATAINKLMVRAMARIPMMGMGKACFYGNRTVKEYLSVNAIDKSNAAALIQPATNQFGNVSPGSVAAGSLAFHGVPFRTIDRIVNNETLVT